MQTINLHIYEKKIIPVLHAKQGDVGRKFKAIITDGTDGYTIPDDANLSVWYSGPSGEGNYSDINDRSAFAISGNTVTVELITQMLNNKGDGKLCLIIAKADGTQIGMWNIPYVVEEVPGLGSKPAEQHLNALADAQKKAENSAIDASVYAQDASMYRDEAREWAEAAEDAANRAESAGGGGGGSANTVLYTTPREEIGVSHESINADYIWGLYDALMAEYPGKVQKKEVYNNDGTFINYAYVISTGEYNTEGYNGGNDSDGDGYEDYLDRDIKKKKYLILSGIHGCERKAVLSAYRFILDVLRGHNMPTGFLESSVVNIMPVGNPSGFTAFTRTNNEGVDINRNFDWNWEETNPGTSYYSGASVASEKETQAIVNWLNENRDAELFVDCHNCSAVNEVASIMGLADDEETDRAKKIALRGLDRIIPYWRDVIGYTAHEARPNGTVLPPVYSYSTSMPINGAVAYYAADALGIPSMALEMSTLQNGDFSDWYENQHLVTPETIAAGAEIIGNILLEFYMNTSEVVDMTETNEKLDVLMERVNSGFYTTSGVMVVASDIQASSSSKIQVNIPCPNGAKLVVLEPDSATTNMIKARTDKNYILNISAHFSNALTEGYNTVLSVWVGKNGVLGQAGSSATNDSGVAIPGITLSVVAGTYNWTAYYWNE